MVALAPAAAPGTVSTPREKTPSTTKVFSAVLSTVPLKSTSTRPAATESLEPSSASSGEAVAEFLALKVPVTTTERSAKRIPLKLSSEGGGDRSPPRPVTWKVEDPKPKPAAWARA